MSKTREITKDISGIHVICDEHAGYEYEVLFADRLPRKREINFPTSPDIPLQIIIEICMREYSMIQEEVLESLRVSSSVCHFTEDTITARLEE